eukprot:SAG31_NODE_22223_length_531_cov_0.722222_1_plen_62_part_00
MQTDVVVTASVTCRWDIVSMDGSAKANRVAFLAAVLVAHHHDTKLCLGTKAPKMSSAPRNA